MKALIFLLWCGSLGAASAQTSTATPTQQLVNEGVRLYDEGKYAEAVAKYQEALAAAPNNVAATTELALTYNALGRNTEAAAMCEKLLKANPAEDASVYVTYGNSLDALKKSKQALQAYEQGLKYHPDSYSLYFNQGVAQATNGQGPASIASFQKAVALNPRHGTSHMSLGIMQLASQARIPAVLALARFLVLEPGSQRAVQRLPLLDEAMMKGVARTGENAVTINLSEKSLKEASRKSRRPDDFAQTELLLTLSGALALGEEAKGVAAIERFGLQFSKLCKSLAEHSAGKPVGFTWEYYVPYFVELEKKGYVPALAYLIHSSQSNVPEVQQWLAAHAAEVAVFQEWSKNYSWPRAES